MPPRDLLCVRSETPAAYVQAAPVQLTRCFCTECLRLDAAHPNEGYQLTFTPTFSFNPKGGRYAAA